MLQSNTRASRSMDMDGWVGVMVGKIGLFWGGIMMRSATFSSLSLPVVDLPWFGVFYLAFCFSWGADAVIPLPIAKVCQEVYAFPVLFYDSTIAFIQGWTRALFLKDVTLHFLRFSVPFCSLSDPISSATNWSYSCTYAPEFCLCFIFPFGRSTLYLSAVFIDMNASMFYVRVSNLRPLMGDHDPIVEFRRRDLSTAVSNTSDGCPRQKQ